MWCIINRWFLLTLEIIAVTCFSVAALELAIVTIIVHRKTKLAEDQIGEDQQDIYLPEAKVINKGGAKCAKRLRGLNSICQLRRER